MLQAPRVPWRNETWPWTTSRQEDLSCSKKSKLLKILRRPLYTSCCCCVLKVGINLIRFFFFSWTANAFGEAAYFGCHRFRSLLKVVPFELRCCRTWHSCRCVPSLLTSCSRFFGLLRLMRVENRPQASPVAGLFFALGGGKLQAGSMAVSKSDRKGQTWLGLRDIPPEDLAALEFLREPLEVALGGRVWWAGITAFISLLVVSFNSAADVTMQDTLASRDLWMRGVTKTLPAAEEAFLHSYDPAAENSWESTAVILHLCGCCSSSESCPRQPSCIGSIASVPIERRPASCCSRLKITPSFSFSLSTQLGGKSFPAGLLVLSSSTLASWRIIRWVEPLNAPPNEQNEPA